MSRDILVRITEDSQRKATWLEVVLPEVEEDGKTIMPEFSVFPETRRVTVTFNTYSMRVRVKRVPETTYSAVDEEGEYDRWTQLDIQNWFELTDKETPEPWKPASWMPHFFRWEDGRGHDTYAFEMYPIGTDPRDPTKALYVYDPDAEHPPVEVEPWTVHLPANWIIQHTHPETTPLPYETEKGGWDAGAFNVFWRERRRTEIEEEMADQDAEFEANKSLGDAEAEARDRAERDVEEDRHRDDGHSEEQP